MLGSIFNTLPISIQSSLTESTRAGIVCHACNTHVHGGLTREQLLDEILKHRGFTCPVCVNTGTPLTSKYTSYLADEKLHRIKNVIESSNLAEKSDQWSDLLTETNMLKLTCPMCHEAYSHSLQYWESLNKCKESTKSQSSCIKCFPVLEITKKCDYSALLNPLRKVHPNIYFVRDFTHLHNWNHRTIEINCGEETVVGDFQISHPNFIREVQKLRSSKNMACILCADALLEGANSSGKTEHILQSRWKFRAAVYATILGDKAIEHASLQLLSDEKSVSIQCHNPEHPPHTFDAKNLFNSPKSRAGYCKHCYKAAGRKTLGDLISELTGQGKIKITHSHLHIHDEPVTHQE